VLEQCSVPYDLVSRARSIVRVCLTLLTHPPRPASSVYDAGYSHLRGAVAIIRVGAAWTSGAVRGVRGDGGVGMINHNPASTILYSWKSFP
jgi:hypothetical protein